LFNKCFSVSIPYLFFSIFPKLKNWNIEYTGYLQTDGYPGYNAVCKKNGNIQLGCWDHARRKFKDAQAAQPKPKKGKTLKISKADRMLSHINQLYRVERQKKPYPLMKSISNANKEACLYSIRSKVSD